MISLRPYQQKCLDDLRAAYRSGKRAPLLVAPTGSGKTVMFCEIARSRMSKGGRTMILAHRAELLEQIDRTLREFGITPGIISPDYPESPDALVQVASVFTVGKRLKRLIPPDFIIIDEAHHAIRKTTWGKVLTIWKSAYRLGVTATPTRLSGEGLDDIFDYMVLGPSVRELTDIGALCRAAVFAPPGPDLSSVHVRMGDYVQTELSDLMSRSTVTGDVLDHYRKHASGMPAIAFCVTVKHANEVTEKFKSGGFQSVCIEGSLTAHERREITRDFAAGRIHCLSNCAIISEGYDQPGAVVGLMLTPTRSLVRHLQSCGRCLRVSPGKERAIILDHAGNTARFGLPSDDREWSLSGAPAPVGGTRVSERVAAIRTCATCFAANAAYRSVCCECGKPLPVKRKVHEAEGELREVTGSQPPPRRPRNDADTLQGLIQLGKMRGYKNAEGWAMHVWDARMKKRRDRGYFRYG